MSPTSLFGACVPALFVALAAGLAPTPAVAAPAGRLLGNVPSAPSAATRHYLEQLDAAERKATFSRGKDGTVKATGWVSEQHADVRPGAKGADVDGFVLHTKGGAIYTLDVPRDATLTSTKPSDPTPRTISSGDVVSVSGVANGKTITASAVQTSAAIVTQRLGPISNAGARAKQFRTVLTILARFSDETTAPDPVTQDQINKAMFDATVGARSVTNYYDQVSRGTFAISGVVTPWVNLSLPRSPCPSGSLLNQWVASAEAAARSQAGVEPDTFDRVMVVLPSQSPRCWYYGIAPTERSAIVWANDDAPATLPFRTGTAAHELGHTFGLGHSGVYVCGLASNVSYEARVPIAAASDCAPSDTNDPSDDMGNTDNFLTLQGFSRAALGFLPLANVATIPADGTPQTLTRNNQPLGTSKQLLRVRRSNAVANPDSDRAFYYLELRGSTGTNDPFDRYPAGHSSVDGIELHLANDFRSEASYDTNAGAPSRVDTAPGQKYYGNERSTLPRVNGIEADTESGLRLNEQLYDPVENYTISLASVGATSAQVRVYAGPPEGAVTAVTIAGSRLTVTGTARANGISVGWDGGDVIVADYGSQVSAPASCRRMSPVAVACPRDLFTAVTISGGDGADDVSVGDDFPLPVTFSGGAGNDAFISQSRQIRIDHGTAPDGADFIGSGSVVHDYSGRTAPLSFRAAQGSSRFVLDSEGDILMNGTLIGGSAADSFVGGNGWEIDGGLGADRYRVDGSSSPRFLSRDGIGNDDVDCGGSGSVVADSGDTVVNCPGDATLAPQVVLAGGPGAAWVTGTVPAYTFSSPFVPATSFQCTFAEASVSPQWLSCNGTSYAPAPTADGDYTFGVQAMNGTVPSGRPIWRSFTVDRTVDTKLTASGGQTSITYTLDSPTDYFTNRSFQCAFDTPTFTFCKPTMTYTGLTDGSAHTFKARTIDRAGNVDATPATHQFTADQTPPDTFASGGPAFGSFTEANSATFALSSNEPNVRFECALDSGTTQDCTSPVTYSGLSASEHWFVAYAIDQVGNRDASIDGTYRRWTVVPPFSTTITLGPTVGKWTNDSTPTFEFSTDAPSPYSFECLYRGVSDFVACSSPFTLPDLPNGSISTFQVRAKRGDGAVDLQPASRTLAIDTTPPTIAITSGPSEGSTVTAATQTFAFTAPGEVASPGCTSASPPSCVRFNCRIDTQAALPCTSPYTTPALAPGQHTVTFIAADAAGNLATLPRTLTYSTAPLPRVLTLGTADVVPSAVSLTGTPTAALDWIHLNGTAPANVDRKSGSPLLPDWTRYTTKGTAVLWPGTTAEPLYSWTNAAGTPTGNSRAGVGMRDGNGAGFKLAIPASNSVQRRLKLWVGVTGTTTTGALAVSFAGETATTAQLQGTSNTVPVVRAFTIDYRPSLASDTLTVSWFQGGGTTATTSQVILYAATLT